MLEVTKGFVNEVDKLWGKEAWIVNNEKVCGKFLILKPGFTCSLHMHPIKDEVFFCFTGSCMVYVSKPSDKAPDFKEEETVRLEEGDSIRIRPGWFHKFWCLDYCTIIEISTPHSDDDVVRRGVSGPL